MALAQTLPNDVIGETYFLLDKIASYNEQVLNSLCNLAQFNEEKTETYFRLNKGALKDIKMMPIGGSSEVRFPLFEPVLKCSRGGVTNLMIFLANSSFKDSQTMEGISNRTPLTEGIKLLAESYLMLLREISHVDIAMAASIAQTTWQTTKFFQEREYITLRRQIENMDIQLQPKIKLPLSTGKSLEQSALFSILGSKK